MTHPVTWIDASTPGARASLLELWEARDAVPIGAMNFFAAALLLPFFILYYGAKPAYTLVTLPLFVLMGLAAALAPGLWLAVINVSTAMPETPCRFSLTSCS